MPVVHAYVPPERFVAGTVGAPGSRTFFLQARSGARITSVSLEKQQVLVLAERMDQLLDGLLENTSVRTTVPAVAPHHLLDSAPLEQPIVEEFRVGTMTLSWDEKTEDIVVEVFSWEAEAEESPDLADLSDDLSDDLSGELQDELRDGLGQELEHDLGDELAEALAEALGAEDDYEEMLLVRMPVGLARAFAARARRVVEAGRPQCPFCGNPMEPTGHLCVRANGFRRRLT